MNNLLLEVEQYEYVKNAYDRIKNLPSPKMSDKLDKFICDCVGLLPAKYGPLIENKIIHELKAKKVKSDKEKGDFRKDKTFFEFKCSFLSKGKSYSITNIRDWHNFNYYVLCFIDVKNNFTPNFYVINKKDILNFSLRGMNGTVDSNTKNTNVGMRVTIQIGSKEMEKLNDMNLLKDKSFDSLNDFVSSFIMRRSTPNKCKFKFNGVDFNSEKVALNYINFLKFFIDKFGHSIVEKSLGCSFSTDVKKFSECVRNSKQYEKLFNMFFISTYTSTQKKINHINKICKSNPDEFSVEFY